MTYDRLTLDQFAGPPRKLPAPLKLEARMDAYDSAASPYATAEQMRIAFSDLGQRLAIAERDAGHVYPEAQE